MLLVGLAGCSPTSPVTLEFESDQLSFKAGETFQLTPTIKGLESFEIIYISMDQSIANISDAGLITAVSVGNTKIVARVQGVDNVRADINITVTSATDIPQVNQTLNLVSASGSSNLFPNQTLRLALLAGENAYTGQITWISSNPSVATVKNGLVSAKAAGSVTITAVANDQFKTIAINVDAQTDDIVVPSITSITVSGTNFVYVSNSATLIATDNNGDTPRLIWVSNDSNIATINELGVVTGVNPGVVSFTAILIDNQDITFTYMMVIREDAGDSGSNITSVEVSGPSEVLAGNKILLAVAYTPASESATFTLSSSNESVATVDSSGWVTGVSGGTVQIFATLNEDTNINASFTVTVLPTPQGLTITGATQVSYGQNVILQAQAYPVGASSAVTWTSSNESVATVDNGGRVTGIATGTVVITAASVLSPSIKSTHQITVMDAKSITLNPTSLSLASGASQVVNATVVAASLSDKSLVWSSSNTAIATVDQTGKVTGIAVGSATIIAKLNADSSVQAQASVSVAQAALPTISISLASTSLLAGTTKSVSATVSNSANTSVTWSSSNTSVATVNSSGLITGVKAGTATITATAAANSSIKATCAVTVTAPPAGTLTVTQSPTGSIAVGNAAGVQLYVADSSGASLSRLECTFTSSASNVATVSAYGTVLALAGGTAKITVTHAKGTGTITLTIGGTTPPVTPPAGTLTVTQSPSGAIAIGASNYQLYVTDASGASLSRTDCTFTSSASNIATVSAYGTVSALAAGTAKITVKHAKGTGTITLTVSGGTTPPVTPTYKVDDPAHIFVDRAVSYTGTFSNVELSGGKLQLKSGATSGTYTSKQFSTAISFTKMVGSWAATYPATNATVEVQYRLKTGTTWTGYLSYRQWARGKTNSSVSASVSGAKISVDEISTTGAAATGFQYTITLRRATGTAASPKVSLVSTSLYNASRNTSGIYNVLNYPTSKQYSISILRQQDVPSIGGIICSATTSTMLLRWKGATSFGGYTRPHEYIAKIVKDSGAGIYGNWCYNTCIIGSYGYDSYVRHMYSYQEIVRHLAYVGPLGISVGGTVAGSFGSYTTGGHLMVVKGYSRSGSTVTFNINDPNYGRVYTMSSTQLMNCFKKVVYVVE